MKKVDQLNALAVKALRKPGRHHDGKGLYLKINPTGAKSWVFRYELDGREHFMGLAGACWWRSSRHPSRHERRRVQAGRRGVSRPAGRSGAADPSAALYGLLLWVCGGAPPSCTLRRVYLSCQWVRRRAGVVHSSMPRLLQVALRVAR
jgi:hypothetical protein